jgi:hypothetical protein
MVRRESGVHPACQPYPTIAARLLSTSASARPLTSAGQWLYTCLSGRYGEVRWQEVARGKRQVATIQDVRNDLRINLSQPATVCTQANITRLLPGMLEVVDQITPPRSRLRMEPAVTCHPCRMPGTAILFSA